MVIFFFFAMQVIIIGWWPLKSIHLLLFIHVFINAWNTAKPFITEFQAYIYREKRLNDRSTKTKSFFFILNTQNSVSNTRKQFVINDFGSFIRLFLNSAIDHSFNLLVYLIRMNRKNWFFFQTFICNTHLLRRLNSLVKILKYIDCLYSERK